MYADFVQHTIEITLYYLVWTLRRLINRILRENLIKKCITIICAQWHEQKVSKSAPDKFHRSTVRIQIYYKNHRLLCF